MTRDKFIKILYNELASDPDNSRANRILEAFDEAVVTNEWRPITYRDLEEDELDSGYTYILTCPLPDEGEEVLISVGNHVTTDIMNCDDGWYFENYDDLRQVDAWMPLPNAYKGDKNDKVDTM